MPVEMLLEAVGGAVAQTAPAPEPDPAEPGPETGAAALRDLAAAGLVGHEAIGDPARIAGEAAALRAVCALVAGPVYRLAPFHYAFAARDGDLDGALADLDPPARTAALAAALAAALGPDAIWLGAVAPAPGAATAEAGGETGAETGAGTGAGTGRLPEAPLLVLRARDAATTAGLAAAGPGLQAVIDADYAVACARLTAGADPAGPLDRRLAALETRLETALETRVETALQTALQTGLETLRAALAVEGEAAAARDRLAREAAEDLAATAARALAEAMERLDSRLAGLVAREDATAAGAAAFRETLGATLAEFLARIERREAEARAPQA